MQKLRFKYLCRKCSKKAQKLQTFALYSYLNVCQSTLRYLNALLANANLFAHLCVFVAQASAKLIHITNCVFFQIFFIDLQKSLIYQQFLLSKHCTVTFFCDNERKKWDCEYLCGECLEKAEKLQMFALYSCLNVCKSSVWYLNALLANTQLFAHLCVKSTLARSYM